MMQCPACSAPLVSGEARCVSCRALVNPDSQGSSALAPRLVTPQNIEGLGRPSEPSILEAQETPPDNPVARSTPDAEWRREVLERVRKRRQVRTHALPLFVEGNKVASVEPSAPAPAPEPTPGPQPTARATALSVSAMSLDSAAVEDRAEVLEAVDTSPSPLAPDVLASLDVDGPDDSDALDLPLRPVEARVEGPASSSQSLVERARPTLVGPPAGNRSLVADLPLVEPSRMDPPPSELPPRTRSAISSRAASMNDRMQAAFIDVGLWSAMCVTAFYFASRIARTSILGLGPAWPGLLLFAVVIASAYVLFFGGLSGATPGKIACGIEVRRYDGSSLGPLASLGRGFLGVFGVTLLGLGVWPAFWDRDRRTLHDRATNSRVTTV